MRKPKFTSTTPSWVPQHMNANTRAATVALVKSLAQDLGTPEKGNFGATLEAIIFHTSALLRDESVRTGRGMPRNR